MVLRALPATEMAELYFAVKNEEWEKAEVRRQLEIVWRAVRLGPGHWTLEAVIARRIRSCCAEATPLRRAKPAGNVNFACRHSSMLVTTPSTVTSALPCPIAESRNFSPPPCPQSPFSRRSEVSHV